MQSLATAAYCALMSFRAAGLRQGLHPIVLSHNRFSAPTTRCTDRSSSGYDGEERLDVPNVALPTATSIGYQAKAPNVGPVPLPNGKDLITWSPPGPSPFSGREPCNVARAFENANAAICARKKVGDVMLLPTVIFMLILWPVLLPALVTAFHVVANTRRNSRRVAWAVTTNRIVGAALR
jgi:hypothetical protein